MPCNCDYMEPTNYEIEHAKVQAFLEELDTRVLPVCYKNPCLSKYYNRPNKPQLDIDVSNLCSKLSAKNDINTYSLEMQMWWRDHQEADIIREGKETIEKQKNETRMRALNKLTIEDKAALGV